LYVDIENGNIRIVDEAQCNGCRECIDACPYIPQMMIWHQEKNVVVKCDLCADTPCWSERGGPGGKQACVEICPMRAITFTSEVPSQTGNKGYEVDLRTQE